MTTRALSGVGLVLTLLTAPVWAGVDCHAILARCQEEPRRCRAAKLKRCLQQGLASCAMVTTTTLPAVHCPRCPTGRCQADGVTCETCEIPPHVTILPGPCDPPNHHPCCDTPPQPIDCATLAAPETCRVLGIPDATACRARLCGLLGLPPSHGCCVTPSP